MKRQYINTRKGKREMIRSLCRGIEKHVLLKVPRMPAEWTGHEIRELLADMFHGERTRMGAFDRAARRSFREKYESDLLNHNL